MHTLSPIMLHILAPFAPCFSRRVGDTRWCQWSGLCSRRGSAQ